MVKDPGMYVEPFAKAGADNLTFHIEVVKGQAVGALIGRIRALGLSAGIAINPRPPLRPSSPMSTRPTSRWSCPSTRASVGKHFCPRS